MLVFLFFNNIFLIRFGYDIRGAFFRFPKNFRNILPHHPQTEELYAANEKHDTNSARPACDGVAKDESANKDDEQSYHGNNGEKQPAPRGNL